MTTFIYNIIFTGKLLFFFTLSVRRGSRNISLATLSKICKISGDHFTLDPVLSIACTQTIALNACCCMCNIRNKA